MYLYEVLVVPQSYSPVGSRGFFSLKVFSIVLKNQLAILTFAIGFYPVKK